MCVYRIPLTRRTKAHLIKYPNSRYYFKIPFPCSLADVTAPYLFPVSSSATTVWSRVNLATWLALALPLTAPITLMGFFCNVRRR